MQEYSLTFKLMDKSVIEQLLKLQVLLEQSIKLQAQIVAKQDGIVGSLIQNTLSELVSIFGTFRVSHGTNIAKRLTTKLNLFFKLRHYQKFHP